MSDQLPHAPEVRALREVVDRGIRARTLVPDLEGALTSLALGGSSEAADAVRRTLESDWPELKLEGELYATLTKARGQLHGAIAEGERAGREMNELLHVQGHALRQPEFAAIRDELNQLAERRAALGTSLSPLATMYASLAPLLPTLREHLERVDEDAIPFPGRALARLTGLLGSIEPVLARTTLELAMPPVGPGRPLPEQIQDVVAFTEKLKAITEDLLQRRQALEAELAEIDGLIRARTG